MTALGAIIEGPQILVVCHTTRVGKGLKPYPRSDLRPLLRSGPLSKWSARRWRPCIHVRCHIISHMLKNSQSHNEPCTVRPTRPPLPDAIRPESTGWALISLRSPRQGPQGAILSSVPTPAPRALSALTFLETTFLHTLPHEVLSPAQKGS